MGARRDDLRIALDQGTGPSGDPVTSLGRLHGVAANAAAEGARLLVTPECSVTGYNIGTLARELAEPAEGHIGAAVSAIAAEHGIAIVYGWPEAAEGRVHNSVRLVAADGTGRATYRKAHLYGELDREAFAPGQTGVVQAVIGGLTLGFLICYDVEFAEAVRAHAIAGTELLVVPTALMHPETAVATALVPVRAMENRMYLAYVNRCDTEGALDYCGLSTLVAPSGEVLARAGADEELLIGDVRATGVAEARAVQDYLADRRPDLYGPLTTAV